MNSEHQANRRRSVLVEPTSIRVTQDDIIIQNEQTAKTLESVVCPVCLMVLTLPHWICEGCDNSFCKDCLEDWWKKNPDSCIFKCEDTRFKVVKRSNTYMAIIDILKVKCKHCQNACSLASVNIHDQTCPKKLVSCQVQGCIEQIPRDLLADHVTKCPFRKETCKFCEVDFLIAEIQNHQENKCLERLLKCQNQQCKEQIKAKQMDRHRQGCQFFKMNCQWCKQDFIKKNFMEHCLNCDKRQIKCQWCQQSFYMKQMEEHSDKCAEKKIKCELCDQQIKENQFKDHKSDCMFSSLVNLKESHLRLTYQNVNLKMKVQKLEQQLEESNRNRQFKTMQALLRVKQEQKKQLERDMLRITNSMQSLKKCRLEEIAQHQKKLHISVSLCVICQTLRKKLEDQLEPLMKMQQQTVAKLKQLQRGQNAAKKSMIRL